MPAILAELNGADGPFRDFRIVRTKSLTRSKTTFTGTLDLSRGLTGLSDPELTTALGDVDLGLDIAGLPADSATPSPRSVRVQVDRRPAGKVTTNAPDPEGGRALWAPDLGQTLQLEASSEALKVDPRIPIAAGAALLLVAGAPWSSLVRRRRRWVRPTVPARR